MSNDSIGHEERGEGRGRGLEQFTTILTALAHSGGPLAELSDDVVVRVALAVNRDRSRSRKRLKAGERRGHFDGIADKLATVRSLFYQADADPDLQGDLGWRVDYGGASDNLALPPTSKQYRDVASALQGIEEIAKAAAARVPSGKGKGSRVRDGHVSITLVRDLAAIYTDATGNKPVMAGNLDVSDGGPFFKFVSATLDAAGYEAAPETIKSAVKEAIKDRSHAQPSSP
jgi:hypothetical protein